MSPNHPEEPPFAKHKTNEQKAGHHEADRDEIERLERLAPIARRQRYGEDRRRNRKRNT